MRCPRHEVAAEHGGMEPCSRLFARRRPGQEPTDPLQTFLLRSVSDNSLVLRIRMGAFIATREQLPHMHSRAVQGSCKVSLNPLRAGPHLCVLAPWPRVDGQQQSMSCPTLLK